jgi:hypothetical protein
MRNTRRYCKVTRGGLSFPQADRLVARWSALIAPHMHELHWVYAKTDPLPEYDYDYDDSSLIYVRSNHREWHT